MITIKRCTKCGEHKLAEEFHKSSRNIGGYSYRCKKCTSEYSNIYNKTEKSLNRRRIYYKTHKIDKVKSRARSITRWAITKKTITKEPCIVCGEVKSEVHHMDYNKPLDVVWFCRKHHRDYHNGIVFEELLTIK